MASGTKQQPIELIAVRPIPCSTADELYLPAARATLARLLGTWLNHHCLTITEFLHSASALEKFEAAGTLYQHAIQRMALTEAAKSHVPVVQIIRALNDLATEAIARVDGDERRGLFPALDSKSLAEMAETLAGAPNARYILNGSLSKYLAAAKTWDDKLVRVLGLRDSAPQGENGRRLFLSAIDNIIAEIARNRTALTELLGAEL